MAASHGNALNHLLAPKLFSYSFTKSQKTFQPRRIFSALSITFVCIAPLIYTQAPLTDFVPDPIFPLHMNQSKLFQSSRNRWVNVEDFCGITSASLLQVVDTIQMNEHTPKQQLLQRVRLVHISPSFQSPTNHFFTLHSHSPKASTAQAMR